MRDVLHHAMGCRMTIDDLKARIAADDDLAWATPLPDELAQEPRALLITIHKQSGTKAAITADITKESDWTQLRQVLTGQREPQTQDHVSRVVGYYSNTKNWNQSKIGELRDRRQGDYSLECASQHGWQSDTDEAS